MIRGYAEHAANERTFLAWVRTGIAVVAFGLVIERFDLLTTMLPIADASAAQARPHLPEVLGSLARYEGLALVLVGLAMIGIAAVRFLRTARNIDSEEFEPAGVRPELVLAGTLAVIVAAFTAYLAVA